MARQAWFADDGTQFESETDARAHDQVMGEMEVANRYESFLVNDMQQTGRIATHRRRIVEEFLRWQLGLLEPPELTHQDRVDLEVA